MLLVPISVQGRDVSKGHFPTPDIMDMSLLSVFPVIHTYHNSSEYWSHQFED